MRETWSQFEQAWRDTLVNKAEAAAFRPLAEFYGVPLPEFEATERGWVEVLKLNAYGSRGNFETVFKSTESIFSRFNVEVPGYVIGSSPQVLFSNDVWPANCVNRLIRKGEKIYFSKSLLAPNQLLLVEQASFYWDEPSEDAGRHDYVFQILPFVIHERSPGRIITSDSGLEDFFTYGEVCLFEVILFLKPEFLVPKTWLQAPSSYADADDVKTPPGVPYGGAVLEGESSIGNPEGYGPYPLYAYDNSIFPQTSKTMSSTMAAGVEYRILTNPPR